MFAVPLVYFFIKCSKRFRICTTFAACILFSSMFRCLNQEKFPEWFTKGGGERYLLIPCMMFFTFIMFLVKRFLKKKSKNFRIRAYVCISVALIAMSLISLSLFWPFKYISYKSDIRSMYYPAQKGSVITIPINPEGYTIKLIKK